MIHVVDATPEKVLQHPVAVFILERHEQHFRHVLFHGRWRLPVAPVRVCTDSTKPSSRTFIRYSRGRGSPRIPLITSTICRWKSSSCRVPSCSRLCLPHALGCQACAVAGRRAGRFAVPAQSRWGQTAHSGYFPFK